jgi:hypothetical protein
MHDVDCSSLEGKRAISDVFEILEFVAVVGTTNTFVLQELDETGKPLPNIFQQDATGNLKAGRYMIRKLYSIYLPGLVFTVFQSLWKKERKFTEGL